jgi:transposase
MNRRYRIELSEAEREELQAMLSGGKQAARQLKRAQILLAADAGVPDETIAASLAVGGSTISRTKRRFVEGNLARALNEPPRPGAARKLTGKEEALLVATACASPDAGTAGRRAGAAHGTRQPLARDGAAALGRDRDQALAPEDVVHSRDQR